MKFANSLLLVCGAVLLLPLAACGVSGDSVHGVVLENGTEKPLAGVQIVATWRGQGGGPVDSSSKCFHTAATVSNEKGEFTIPSWRRKAIGNWETGLFGGPRNSRVSVAPYLTEHTWIVDSQVYHNIYHLERFNGGNEQRLQYLDKISKVGCHPMDGSDKSKLAYLRAVLKELLAVPGSDRPNSKKHGDVSAISELRFDICVEDRLDPLDPDARSTVEIRCRD